MIAAVSPFLAPLAAALILLLMGPRARVLPHCPEGSGFHASPHLSEAFFNSPSLLEPQGPGPCSLHPGPRESVGPEGPSAFSAQSCRDPVAAAPLTPGRCARGQLCSGGRGMAGPLPAAILPLFWAGFPLEKLM